VNVAFHQKSISAAGKSEHVNDTEQTFADIGFPVVVAPAFLVPKSFRFDRFSAEGLQRFSKMKGGGSAPAYGDAATL
jgi:hypothetical protein